MDVTQKHSTGESIPYMSKENVNGKETASMGSVFWSVSRSSKQDLPCPQAMLQYADKVRCDILNAAVNDLFFKYHIRIYL